MPKLRELQDEFKSVFSGRSTRLLDSFLPLLIFLILYPLIGINYALWGALLVAGLFAIYRIIRRESLVYSLGALGGVLLASIFIHVIGSEAGFFLPGLFSGAIMVVLCMASVALNRPLVAWTSSIARRWPLDWYWHPKVRPAYNEVTVLWGVAFSARLALEFWFFQRQALGALGAVRVFLGWPFTIVLLVVSYLYGVWRLSRLKGPGIEEFNSRQAPPWVGQKQGF
jgi:hypothetical protein